MLTVQSINDVMDRIFHVRNVEDGIRHVVFNYAIPIKSVESRKNLNAKYAKKNSDVNGIWNNILKVFIIITIDSRVDYYGSSLVEYFVDFFE